MIVPLQTPFINSMTRNFNPKRSLVTCLTLITGWVLGVFFVGNFQVQSDVFPDDCVRSNWPGFRGPGSIGLAYDVDPPTQWSVETGENILWKVAVPKPGMSSPVVWGEQLFVTGADVAGRVIYCYDTNSGELKWAHEAQGISGSPGPDELPRVLAETGFAASTMATNGEFAAAIFATGDLVCLNMQGERIWATSLGIPENHYGHASSLICYKGSLLVQFDQKKESRLIAFDLATGNCIWETQRTEISWSSPILIQNNQRIELILTDAKSATGYDPASGKLLWRIDWQAGELAPSAAFSNGTLFLANEYAIATGYDISAGEAAPRQLWSYDKILPEASSPIAPDGYLILPTAYGAISCLEQRTGKVLWEHDFDVGFYSSPVLANGRIYLGDLDGNVQIIQPGKEFALLATNKMNEDIYATPAFQAKKIFIRGVRHLYCISESAQ